MFPMFQLSLNLGQLVQKGPKMLRLSMDLGQLEHFYK